MVVVRGLEVREIFACHSDPNHRGEESLFDLRKTGSRGLFKRRGGEAAIAPGVQAAFQRANARDAFAFQDQRHTGAGSFVGSSTVEDDVAIARNGVVMLLQLFSVQMMRAGDDRRVGFEVYGVPQIHDEHFFAGVELLHQLFGQDPGDAQRTDEALPLKILPADVARQAYGGHRQQAAAQPRRLRGNFFELAAENVAQREKAAGPDERAQRVVDQEARRLHVKYAGQWRRDGVQSGNELGVEQRLGTVTREDAFGLADAGIWLQRNLAEQV